MDNNKLSSIEKALLVLNQLSEPPFEYKAMDLANILEMNRATVHRILNTLLEKDFVIKDKNNKEYRLGPKVYKLGSVYLSNFNYGNKIEEILNEIAEKTKESVGVGIRDNEKIISLYEIEIHQPLKMNYRPGIFYPMNRGCYGKCLMAYYDQDKVEKLLEKKEFEKVAKNTLITKEEILLEYENIRNQGYVTSIEETFEYAIGVGIPIFNRHNEVTTCVAVSFLKNENYLKKIEEIKDVLFDYRDKIAKYMP
ncbi:IclR family transcriptional regulator [Clostridium sp. D2Q-14]|uniref:IclR family transcriptional regulator n=1 Tax=Anaeromonas gelatinilytica TaxID=2683194 RepID=UPI00193BDEB0|nr:IclR family transcriptional regulator [Anaeromonas gelatinilytica]MBS4536663.1 IclR family transcriptional regulator [Anaeromonas gelatinilytica]